MLKIADYFDSGSTTFSINILLAYVRPYIWSFIDPQALKEGDPKLHFEGVKYINIEVVTELLKYGLLLKENGKRLQIHLEYESDVTTFLKNQKFVELGNRRKLFNFMDTDGSDFKTDKTNPSRTFLIELSREILFDKYDLYFKNNTTLDEKTKLKQCLKHEIMGIKFLRECYNNSEDKKFIMVENKDSKIKYTDFILTVSEALIEQNKDKQKDKVTLKELYDVSNILVEIASNAIYHGNNTSFLACQVYSKGDNIILQFSISDCGEGFYLSLEKQFAEQIKYNDPKKPRSKIMSEDDFLSLKNDIHKNYYSIFEALLYRKISQIRGLYHICNKIFISEYPKCNIINNNIFVQFNEDWIIKIIDEDIKTVIETIKNKNRLLKVNDIKNKLVQYLPDQIKGVHVYFEYTIPRK